MRRKALFLVVVGATLVLLAGGLLVLRVMTWRAPIFEPPVVIRIERGNTLQEVAGRLEQAHLVYDATALTVLARLRGIDHKVRSGEYEFRGGSNAIEVLDVLAHGPQRVALLAIPEGLNVDEVARLLAAAELGPADAFSTLARDSMFAASLGVPRADLEGYLFPDTYSFDKGTPPDEILRRMARRFFEIFNPNLASAATAAGLTMDQAVILASLIEKEAAVDGERAIISAVFHNRLALGMPLQSDPTVLYGIANPGERILVDDLVRQTPYNTYRIAGLPAGPIANPGRASLEAAVHPAKGVKALYFVSRNDRTHEFNETLAAHQRAVDRYQRGTQ